jgi:hypothetical protein
MRVRRRGRRIDLDVVRYKLYHIARQRNSPAAKYEMEGAMPLSIINRLLHSYAPKKHTVPVNDPRKAGCTPPYSPLLKPSCRHIV